MRQGWPKIAASTLPSTSTTVPVQYLFTSTVYRYPANILDTRHAAVSRRASAVHREMHAKARAARESGACLLQLQAVGA